MHEGNRLHWMNELPSVAKINYLLQNCRRQKNLEHAKKICANICNNVREGDRNLGNHIVPMFVECGSIYDALQAFNSLLNRSEYSWTSLMFGFIHSGQPHNTFSLYQKMKEDNVDPSVHTFAGLLRACARVKDAQRGREIHFEIARKGFEVDLVLGGTLVDMYAKCGLLGEAQEIFDNLPQRDVISWTTLIARYFEQGFYMEVLKCFEDFQLEGMKPNTMIFVCTLKACSILKALEKGQLIHKKVAEAGLEGDIFVATTVVNMYAKCGSLKDAQIVFDQLPLRDVALWNALITGYSENHRVQEALTWFEQMQLEMSPNSTTFSSILKACGNIGALSKGRELHTGVYQMRLNNDPFIGNTLVAMYCKCGSLTEAWDVFDRLPVQNVVSWTALVAGCVENGFCKDALRCFEQMQLCGVSPNVATFVCSVKACGILGAIEKGRDIHALISQIGCEEDLSINNTLVGMYAKCRKPAEAWQVFKKLPVRDTVSWNAIIAGFVENELHEDALKCLERLQADGILPDAVTFICSLKACTSLGTINKGREIHIDILREGFQNDISVCNTLIDMYAQCGSVAEAEETFDKSPVRNVVSWTVMIAGYAENGYAPEALKCFNQMKCEHVSPNVITYICILKVCAILRDIDKARELHTEIAKKGFDSNIYIANSLIDMYVKCGSLREAVEAFDKLPVRDVVAWTALLAGYAENDLGEETMKCLEQMQSDGLSPNSITAICSLKACSSIATISKGREIHDEVLRKGFGKDLLVGTTLIDMYAKCGALKEAREVFDKLPDRDLVSWNAMIRGYGLNHQSEMALQCFEGMQEEGIKPDVVTFTSIFAACSRAGCLTEGQSYFSLMTGEYGIVPTLDHYNCMVDLLSRSGLLYEAEKVLENVPFLQSKESWTPLLSACKTYGESELGSRCFQELRDMGPENASSYVLMSNIYASTTGVD